MMMPSEEDTLAALTAQLRELIAVAVGKGVDYRQCFEHFDGDFSGLIDRGEFRVGLQRLARRREKCRTPKIKCSMECFLQ